MLSIDCKLLHGSRAGCLNGAAPAVLRGRACNLEVVLGPGMAGAQPCALCAQGGRCPFLPLRQELVLSSFGLVAAPGAPRLGLVMCIPIDILKPGFPLWVGPSCGIPHGGSPMGDPPCGIPHMGSPMGFPPVLVDGSPATRLAAVCDPIPISTNGMKK